MKIQSLSVVVPSKGCVNDCRACVSKMHESDYENMITGRNLYYTLYKEQYLSRMQYARDNGCNTVMLTGVCEPLQNWDFLREFGNYNQMIQDPFRTIEIQTVGNLLTDDWLFFLRHHVKVSTISLSIWDPWYSTNNQEIIQCKEGVFLEDLCERIKKYRFNLRISLNMSDYILNKQHSVRDILVRCKILGADQVTFRKLYYSEGSKMTEEAQWVQQHEISGKQWDEVNNAVIEHGKFLDELEYGRMKYNVQDMSVVIDDDCMSKNGGPVAKYLILRPDCKLYSKWDTKASLIF